MNENQRRVILYGDSLILEGVWANLKNHPALEVIVLGQRLQKPSEELAAYAPATVILDLGAIQQDALLPLLQRPDLLLIGIDPETHQALVWSGKQASAVAAVDLIDIICPDSLQKPKPDEI
jgi:hypothetical protein